MPKLLSLEDAVLQYLTEEATRPRQIDHFAFKLVMLPRLQKLTGIDVSENYGKFIENLTKVLGNQKNPIRYEPYDDFHGIGFIKAYDEIYEYRHKHKEQNEQKKLEVKTIVEPAPAKETIGKNKKITTEKTPKYEHAYI